MVKGLDQHLVTWLSLNAFIMGADEATCKALLELERKGKKRIQFLRRIQSRINRLRSARELAELSKGKKPDK